MYKSYTLTKIEYQINNLKVICNEKKIFSKFDLIWKIYVSK